MLIATGRRPVVDGLDLEKAGVLYDERGIQVDDVLRTSQQHIYAAGDCTGGPQFTHYAGWQATLAARNALLPGASKAVTDQVPWTTFTDPEVAHVGLTEPQARERFGDAIVTCDWPMARVDRARTDRNTAGFIKLVHKCPTTSNRCWPGWRAWPGPARRTTIPPRCRTPVPPISSSRIGTTPCWIW
ncbi:MAG TPA: hypothetical protein ENN87_02570 [Phycisphaerales bacterium]|nr:hypothetical protein [Phycisphaerales bacterium]